MNKPRLSVRRLADGPIIHPGLDSSIGENIQGPSLIRVPSWVEHPLGRYYLYFADHKGAYIRLAYADALRGPWRIHVPGSLQLAESHFPTQPPPVDDDTQRRIRQTFKERGIELLHDPIVESTTPHIASPDVHVDETNQRIIMYFHGLEDLAHQVTRVATSFDGVSFTARPEVLGRTYWRAFNWRDQTYALAMPGQFYRSSDPLDGFEAGPLLFNTDMRHSAVLVQDDTLHVFWTQVGDAPEHIKHSRIELSEDWWAWNVDGADEVLRPERDYEGADAPVQPSVRSSAYGIVNQLRDPAIFVEDESIYLLYAVAGEAGIALAEIGI